MKSVFFNALCLFFVTQLNSNIIKGNFKLLGSQNDHPDNYHEDYLGEHDVVLNDKISEYKFIFVATSYYSDKPRPVYGSVILPLFLLYQPEWKYYPTMINNQIKTEAIRLVNETTVRVKNSSGHSIGIYGII
mgnify:FL=1